MRNFKEINNMLNEIKFSKKNESSYFVKYQGEIVGSVEKIKQVLTGQPEKASNGQTISWGNTETITDWKFYDKNNQDTDCQGETRKGAILSYLRRNDF